MRVQSTVRCHCPDCNGQEYPIEFSVNKNGRIHCEPIPLYDELNPCLMEIKSRAEGKLLFPPNRYGETWFDTAEIRESIRRAIFTLDDQHKVEVETREDAKRIAFIIRQQGYPILFQVFRTQRNTPQEQQWPKILNKMHQLGLDTSEIIRELTKVALKYLDSKNLPQTAQNAFEALMECPFTKSVAAETLQEIIQTQPDRISRKYGLVLAWETAIARSKSMAIWSAEYILEQELRRSTPREQKTTPTRTIEDTIRPLLQYLLRYPPPEWDDATCDTVEKKLDEALAIKMSRPKRKTRR